MRILFLNDVSPAIPEPLITALNALHATTVEVSNQQNVPADWELFDAVVGYLQQPLLDRTAAKIIAYTQNGGLFVALHHMISGNKANAAGYFDFLGIRLPDRERSSEPVQPGSGYGWYHDGDNGAELTVVNLAPEHPITSNGITWSDSVLYPDRGLLSERKPKPAFKLARAEVYLNHVFTDGTAKTSLCGLKFRDPRNDFLFEQDTLAWTKSAGAGRITYFQPGHFRDEFEHPIVRQMILNAVQFGSF